ncbi:MAG: hypothetical protein R3C19_13885 [Planctomycetaceae bacterium]
MFLYIRETVGWLLVGSGLLLMVIAVFVALNRQVVEAGVVVFAAMSVLKAGTLLVRVSTAARIALGSNESDDAGRHPLRGRE